MKISVVVCSYNREKYIPELFQSLCTQGFESNEYEIILVDNNSTDNTKERFDEIKEEFRNINLKYFLEEEQGLSHARNRGIAESKGGIIVFIDDDAVASTDYLQSIWDFFESTPDCHAGGGKILPRYENTRPKWMSHFLEPVLSTLNLGNKTKPFSKTKFPIGANMFFRRSVFQTVGNFSVHLGRTGKKMLGGEEKDLFYRMKKNGQNVYYLPQAWIYHIIPDDRLTFEFIKKQALGVGCSEHIRATQTDEKQLLIAKTREILKWGATLCLFVFYCVFLQFEKAKMLVKFRYFVSLGLFCKKKNCI